MKQIFLTQGKVALVDDEDFERLNLVNWQAIHSGNTFYAVRMIRTFKGRCTERMHRCIVDAGLLHVDHIDGDGLNNQKSNLRVVTNRENSQNKHITKTSKYPGVWWDKTHDSWHSQIQVAGKRKSVGYFKTEWEAFAAYKRAVDNIEVK